MDNIFYFLKKANKVFSLWYIPHPQISRQASSTMTYGSRPLEYQINIDQTDEYKLRLYDPLPPSPLPLSHPLQYRVFINTVNNSWMNQL